MEKDLDTDPYEREGRDVVGRNRDIQRELRERAEQEKKRLKERPIFQLLGAAVIVSFYLAMLWIFGEPESFWGCVGQILAFTIISVIAATGVAGRVGHPTHGTSGALGVAIIWLFCTGAILVLGLVIAGVSVIFGNVEALQWVHLISSALIGGLAILVTIAL